MNTLKFLPILLLGFVSIVGAQNYSVPTGAGSSGTDNTSVGTSAGSNGSFNTSVGKAAGDVVTGSYNSFYGMNAGRVVSSASSNTFTGYGSGYSTTTGGSNTFSGRESGYSNLSGTNNLYMGYQAGYSNTNAYNVFLGSNSGRNSTTGSNNTFIGYNSGYANAAGTGNVFVGYNAGSAETGSNKLYIDNSNTSTPLIYGDFGNNQVGINSLPVSTHTLSVNGTFYTSGTIYTTGLLVNGATVDDWVNSGPNLNYTAGMVSIGTSTAPTGYKLAVGGKVVCEEIVVKLQANWPDYVFETAYQLPSLQQVKTYINVNKHLPGIPSAAEVRENGVTVGEMNAKLLEKIEELTLYLIQQDEKIKELEKKLNNK